MSLIARMIIPISVIVTLATSFIGWKAYSDARDSVAEATRILEISTLDAVGRELTTVMNLTRQHLLTVADRIAIIELLRNPDESPEGERSKLLTRHLRRAVLDFPSIDGLAVLNSRGTVIDHIAACYDAIQDGVELFGYCPWSVMDILSSHQGFKKRYGFIYVNRADHDLKDLRRIPKDSFYWYQNVIQNHGLTD